MSCLRDVFWSAVVVFIATLLCPARSAKAYQNINQANSAPVQVQGKVILDSDASPVSGVTVSLLQISDTPKPTSNPLNGGTITTTPIPGGTPGTSSASTSATVISAMDGTFGVGGLATGQFAVCVKDPAAAIIDPCVWKDAQPTVAVTAGSLSSGLVVRVKKASLVDFEVHDTAQVLVQKANDVYPPHIVVGAFDVRGDFHPAQERRSPNGITYRLAIPVDSIIRVIVYSPTVQLATSSNAQLAPQGYSATFVQPSNQSQANSFSFNALGRK